MQGYILTCPVQGGLWVQLRASEALVAHSVR